VWGPDGKLYWSIGDRGYSFTTREGRHFNRPYTGGVLRCDPDGSNLEEVYTGLRNPQELAFDEFGNLFTCDNNADAWDSGRLVYVMEGGDSGWNHGHQVLMNFRNQLKLRTPVYRHPEHKEIPMNPWMTEAIWEPDHAGRPAYALPPIDKISWGPSGLVYNYGATAMPTRYSGHFWVCNFGGANGDLEAFSVKNRGAGFAVAHREVFMVGLGNTDVEFGPDGRMYLSCFNNSGWYKQDLGNIYVLESRISENEDILKNAHELLVSDFSSIKEENLGKLLGHRDMRIRQRAQFTLAKRGASSVFVAATARQENQLKRLHGIWGLGQLAGRDPSLLATVVSLLADPDVEVRAQAARVLSDSRTAEAGEALVACLNDESARVKAFAAIGVGKCGNIPALTRLLEILAENDNKDPFLRHACVQGIWYLNEREKILKEIKNDSPAVRLGVLLALRKLEDPRVKYFLADKDETVRFEAIRAISDLDLLTALPDLAREIEAYVSAASGVRMPGDHRDWIIQTRLINANFRVGQPENASRLLAYAAQPALPQMLREQALLAILEWPNPNPVDATNGNFRPLSLGSRADITAVVKTKLPDVFTSAEGSLLGLATRVALAYGVNAPVELLTAQISNEDTEVTSRISSLEGLSRQEPTALVPLWDKLLKSDHPRFRASVAEQLLSLDPARGLAATLDMAGSGNVPLRQQGYRLLADSPAPEAITLFEARLKAIDQEPAGSLLDLLESASRRKEKSISDLLAAYGNSLDSSDPAAVFKPSLEGGDPEKGREIFLTHAVGQCSKCHKIDGDGGMAGPELTGIGSRQKREYLLESIVSPSAVVLPGYGITLVTLKDGESLGGALMGEDSEKLILKVPDPAWPEKQIERSIPLSEIESRQPPVSAMPPMAYLLTKSEIRDLVAYLGTLREKPEKKSH